MYKIFSAVLLLLLVFSFVHAVPRFVAGGTDGIIAFSEDGNSWTKSYNSQSVFDNNTIRAIAWNGSNLFVATGLGFHTAISSDGNVWTRSDFNGASGYALKYGNGKFVMGATGDRIYISTDGNNWVASNNALSVFGTVSPVFGVAYDDSTTWVAVGGASGGSVLMYSTDDGNNWTNSSGYNFDNNTAINAVDYNSSIGTWVAVGGGGKIAYSFDGTSWTKSSISSSVFGALAGNGGRSVTWGNNKFVSGGAIGRIGFSSNGNTWTRSYNDTTIFGTTLNFQAICYDSNISKFVVGGSFGKMGFSSDGNIWVISRGDKNSQTIFGSATTNIIYGLLATNYVAPSGDCSPTINQDWSISTQIDCTDANINLGTGKLILTTGGKLTLTNSNVTGKGLELRNSGVQVWLKSGSWLKIS